MVNLDRITNGRNGVPMSANFNIGKAITKGLEGAVIAGLSGAGGITAVESVTEAQLDTPEQAVTTVSIMVFGFLFRYLRNWFKQKRRERRERRGN